MVFNKKRYWVELPEVPLDYPLNKVQVSDDSIRDTLTTPEDVKQYLNGILSTVGYQGEANEQTNLFDLGLDSLALMQLNNQIKNDLHVELPLEVLSQNINIKSLEEIIVTSLTGKDSPSQTYDDGAI